MPTIRSRLDRRRDARPRDLRWIVRSALIALVAPVGCVAVPGIAAAATNGRIAFASDRAGDLEIYSMNADGSGQR
jgi:hypothetical protein